jgi:hypothetical protein
LCPRVFSRCSNAPIDLVKGPNTNYCVVLTLPALWQSIFATVRARWKVPSHQPLRSVGLKPVQSNQKASSISFPDIIPCSTPSSRVSRADTIEGDLQATWEAISGAAQVRLGVFLHDAKFSHRHSLIMSFSQSNLNPRMTILDLSVKTYFARFRRPNLLTASINHQVEQTVMDI